MADFGVASLVVAADLAPVEETWDDIPLDGSVLFGAVPTPDVAAPTVDNFSPSNGSAIAAADPIFFDVKDTSGLFRRVHVYVTQGAVTELAHDGDVFLAPYDTLSTRTNITDGFRFRLRRDGGWVGTVTVGISAIDRSGNENV